MEEERVIKISQLAEILDENMSFYLDWHLKGIIEKTEYEALRGALDSVGKLAFYRSEKLPTKETA